MDPAQNGAKGDTSPNLDKFTKEMVTPEHAEPLRRQPSRQPFP